MRTKPSWRAVSAIAQADLTDRLRAGISGSLLVQPAVLLLLLLTTIVAPSLSPVKVGTARRTIAVASGSPAEGPAARLVTDLAARHPRFVLRPVSDVGDEVATEAADAGLLVTDAGREVQVVSLPTRGTSRFTAAELTDALRALQLEQTGVTPPTIVRGSLQGSSEAGRITLAGPVPLLITLQLLSVFAAASSRLRGGKGNRSAEVFHVLPVHRMDLVVGRAVVGVGDGALRLAAMLLVVAALPLVPSSIGSFSISPGTLAVLAVAGLCQVVVATAGGSLLGALARTEGQANAVQAILNLGLSVGFIALTFQSTGPLPSPLAAVPFIGPIFWARNTFFSGGRATEALLAVGISVTVAGACTFLAARALDRDGVTLREA